MIQGIWIGLAFTEYDSRDLKYIYKWRFYVKRRPQSLSKVTYIHHLGVF